MDFTVFVKDSDHGILVSFYHFLWGTWGRHKNGSILSSLQNLTNLARIRETHYIMRKDLFSWFIYLLWTKHLVPFPWTVNIFYLLSFLATEDISYVASKMIKALVVHNKQRYFLLGHLNALPMAAALTMLDEMPLWDPMPVLSLLKILDADLGI